MITSITWLAWKLYAEGRIAGSTVKLGRMAHLDPGVLAWASAALGNEVTVVRSLRLGGSPWLLRTGDQNTVLRVAAAERAGEAETEVAALTYAACAADPGLPVAEVLGYDLAEQTGYALVLTGQLRTGSAWCTAICGTATRCGAMTAA